MSLVRMARNDPKRPRKKVIPVPLSPRIFGQTGRRHRGFRGRRRHAGAFASPRKSASFGFHPRLSGRMSWATAELAIRPYG